MEFLKELLPILVTALVTYFLSRKKENAETQVKLLEAEERAFEVYRKMLDDLTNRFEKAVDTIETQREQIKSLIAEIEHLTEELKKYKQLNGKQS